MPFPVGGIERVDIEVVDADIAADIVERGTLAQGGTEHAIRVEDRLIRMPGKEVLPVVAREVQQAKQVTLLDRLV